MAEVLGLIGVVLQGLPLIFEAKRYFDDRKKRKREKKPEALQNQVNARHESHNYYYTMIVTTPIHDICGTSNYLYRSASSPSNLHHVSAAALGGPSQPSRLEPSAPPLPIAYNHSSIGTNNSLVHQTLHKSISYPADIQRRAHEWCYALSQKKIGGRIDALAPSQAHYYSPDTPPSFAVAGIRIGSDPNALNTVEVARIYWSYFEKRMVPSTLPPTVGVVCWEHKTVDMFMLRNRLYYKLYRVYSCDVGAFSASYHEHEVFSGEIVGGRLKRCNKEVKFVEPSSAMVSTNSWLKLGLNDTDQVSMDEYDDAPIFVSIAVGALFGLLCCLYPSSSNVAIDMKPSMVAPASDIVACINSHNYPFPVFDPSSSIHFSVFSFNIGGWADRNVLLG